MATPAPGEAVFDRLLCGVDGSPSSFEALRQSVRILAPGGSLCAATVDSSSWAALVSPPAAERTRAMAREVHGRVRDQIAGMERAEASLVEGAPVPSLLALADETTATLIVVGSHGVGRVAGILMGGVATAVVHRAPCSVLVAREPADPAGFPSRVLVGVDGSEPSLAASETGRVIADRFGASLERLAAVGGKGVDRRRVAAAGEIDLRPGDPVDVLLEASAAADLLVVGSRGLHGVRALGSVSERLAHRASCSVLVVREARPPSPLAEAAKQLRVAEVMSCPVVTVAEDATLAEVAQVMLEHQVGGVPVVDGRGEVVGMVTQSDFLGKEDVLPSSRYGYVLRIPRVFGRWLVRGSLEEILDASRELPAREVMSSPVVTAREDESVQRAAERLLRHDVNRLPVVRDGRPVGVFSRQDVLRCMSARRAAS